MTPIPPSAASPDLSASFNSHGSFLPNSWFYAYFGEIPRREIYQLVTAEARQTILDALAATQDLEQITVVKQVFMEEADKAQIGSFTAFRPVLTPYSFSVTTAAMATKALLFTTRQELRLAY